VTVTSTGRGSYRRSWSYPHT